MVSSTLVGWTRARTALSHGLQDLLEPGSVWGEGQAAHHDCAHIDQHRIWGQGTPEKLTPKSSAYEVVRGMAADYSSGTDAVAACLAAAERRATDAHVWALVDWLATKLPSSDAVAVALSAVKRNRGTVQASVATHIAREKLTDQPTLLEENS
jgi:hypothetical protein